jgi:hypothetical protein
MTTDAALRKESRARFINATALNRKSGGAEWRDLRFSPPCSDSALKNDEESH